MNKYNISKHALNRFEDRFKNVFYYGTHKNVCLFDMDRINQGKTIDVIEDFLANSSKLDESFFKVKKNKLYLKNGDCLLRRCKPFTFIIKDNTVVTVVVSNDRRDLNFTF